MEIKSTNKSLTYYIVWYTNVFLSITTSYYIMHLIANDSIRPTIVTSVTQSYTLFSIFLLAHIVVRWILNELKQSIPSLQCLYTCINNIINNSILYFVIMVCLTFPENYEKVYNENQILMILELFLWGRIIFSIGYTLGTLVNAQSLRSYGFGFCIASLVTMFSPFINMNFIDSFK